MNSMPQHAVTNGKGKNENFRPQLIILWSFEVMTPVPNIVSRPIWMPFSCTQEHQLQNDIAVMFGAHECRQHDSDSQAASRCIRVICFPCNLTFELFQGRQDLRNRHFNCRKVFLRNAPHSPQIYSLVVMTQHISESCHQTPGNRSMHSPKL